MIFKKISKIRISVYFPVWGCLSGAPGDRGKAQDPLE